MKKTITCFFCINLCLLFSACFEKLDIPIYQLSKPALVIEGLITNAGVQQWVRISQTTPYNDSAVSLPVNNAQVILRDNTGQQSILNLKTPGLYVTDTFYGQINNEYSLEVTYDDKIYTATEKMLPIGKIDSLHIVYKKNDLIYPDGNYVTLYAHKSETPLNYYRAKVSVNDSLYNNYANLLVFDDNYTSSFLEYILPYPFQSSDTVKIEIYSLTENVFNYFYTLARLTNNLYTISPLLLNPPSNISGGSLGYFGVSAVESVEVVIP